MAKVLVNNRGKVLLHNGKVATSDSQNCCCFAGPTACGETCTARNLTEVSRITISLAVSLSSGNDHCSVSLNRTFSHTWTRVNHIFPSGGETIGADEFVFYQEPNPFILPELGCIRTLKPRFTYDLEASELLDDGEGFSCPVGFDPDNHSGDGNIGFILDVSPPVGSCETGEGRFGDINVFFGAECGFIDTEEPHDTVGCGTGKSPFLSSISYPYFAESLTGTFISSGSDSGTDISGSWSYAATLTITVA